MCGIAGRLDLTALGRDARDSDPAARATVEAMCDAQVHRGPDGGATIARGPLAMGMRRLSIIDLETGMQPIANEDETVRAAVRAAGYRLAVATRPGPVTAGSDPLALARTFIARDDSLADFERKLAGAFDVLHHGVQWLRRGWRSARAA